MTTNQASISQYEQDILDSRDRVYRDVKQSTSHIVAEVMSVELPMSDSQPCKLWVKVAGRRQAGTAELCVTLWQNQGISRPDAGDEVVVNLRGGKYRNTPQVVA